MFVSTRQDSLNRGQLFRYHGIRNSDGAINRNIEVFQGIGIGAPTFIKDDSDT